MLAVSTSLFAVLSAAVLFWERADRLDVRAVSWVQRTAPDGLVDVMHVVTYAGSAVFLGPLVILAGAFFLWRGRPGATIFVIAASAGSQLSSQALKALFQRGRPELEDPLVQLTTYAYPSGHAFGATATYGSLALVLASAPMGRRGRIAVLTGAAALIFVVGASRVILGRHYALDVLAGLVGGVALLSALLLVLARSPSGARRFELFSRGNQQPERPRLDSELER